MKVRSVLVFAAAGLGLAACGGGSGSESEPVTQASAPPPPPVSSKLVIRGAVTDDPIDSAAVTFRVGDRQFEAQRISDTNGAFEVEIEYDSPNDLVIGDAFRSATGIRFVGDVLTVGDLLAAARDGVVDGHRITNLTTAKHVLATMATQDGSIDSFDEFVASSDGVNPGDFLVLGAAIKVVVESIDGTALPADVADTLELAERIAGGDTSFVDDLNTLSPGTLAFAIDKLLNDGFATLDFDANEVPGVYMSSSTALAYAFFADGSGLAASFADEPVARVEQWDVNADGDLALTFVDNPRKAEVLQLLSQTADRRQINVKRDDDGAERSDPVGAANFTVYSFSGAFSASSAAGTYQSADGSSYELYAGGAGVLRDANGAITRDVSWRVDGNGRLVLDFGGGNARSFTRLAGSASDGPDRVRVLALDLRTSGAIEGFEILDFSKS